jgi:hypothetical protein
MLNLSRNQLGILIGLLTGHCHLRGYTFKIGLIITALETLLLYSTMTVHSTLLLSFLAAFLQIR